MNYVQVQARRAVPYVATGAVVALVVFVVWTMELYRSRTQTRLRRQGVAAAHAEQGEARSRCVIVCSPRGGVGFPPDRDLPAPYVCVCRDGASVEIEAPRQGLFGPVSGWRMRPVASGVTGGAP